MKVVCVSVEDNSIPDNDSKGNYLRWYPISCLKDFLTEKTTKPFKKGYTTITSKYALRLFYDLYKHEIEKMPSRNFPYDDRFFSQSSPWLETGTIM